MAARNVNVKSAAPNSKDKSPTGARKKVYEIAAEVFHVKGYDKTSMSDIAAAVGLTKAGLYHHVASKEQLLYTILDYGMDMTEHHVMGPLASVTDPVLRLRTMIELHLKLILEGRKLAVTGLLHECRGLSTGDQNKINRRKKQYVQLVSDIIPRRSRKDGRQEEQCESQGRGAGPAGNAELDLPVVQAFGRGEAQRGCSGVSGFVYFRCPGSAGLRKWIWIDLRFSTRH